MATASPIGWLSDSPCGTMAGPLIKVGDKVVIHSTGTVKQSAITFDDSREGGFAYTVAVGVNRAIRGMDTALLQMRKGCHRRAQPSRPVLFPFAVFLTGILRHRQLLITADHAYGAEGLRPHVPPNADVIYDVEVVDINESLVAQGIRARREEEARTARYLKIQDAERALEAAGEPHSWRMVLLDAARHGVAGRGWLAERGRRSAAGTA